MAPLQVNLFPTVRHYMIQNEEMKVRKYIKLM